MTSLLQELIESDFRTSSAQDKRRACNRDGAHAAFAELRKKKNPYGAVDSAEYCAKLVQEIGLRSGVQGAMAYYLNNTVVLEGVLTGAYQNKAPNEPAHNLIHDGVTIAVTDKAAADAGAAFALLHRGRKRLAGEMTDVIYRSVAAYNPGESLPANLTFPVPEVKDTTTQIKECYKGPASTQNKMACAIAGETEMLKRLGIIVAANDSAPPAAPTVGGVIGIGSAVAAPVPPR